MVSRNQANTPSNTIAISRPKSSRRSV
jgi:hypothetical protein